MSAISEQSAARPSFKSLSTSTAADWAVICDEHRRFFAGLPGRILSHLQLLDNDYGGFPVDRLILLTGLLLRKHIRRPP